MSKIKVTVHADGVTAKKKKTSVTVRSSRNGTATSVIIKSQLPVQEHAFNGNKILDDGVKQTAFDLSPKGLLLLSTALHVYQTKVEPNVLVAKLLSSVNENTEGNVL